MSCTDPDGARITLDQPAELGPLPLQDAHHIEGCLIKSMPCRCQRGGEARTINQIRTQPMFERANAPAEGGLADVALFRRARKIASRGETDEIFQPANLHGVLAGSGAGRFCEPHSVMRIMHNVSKMSNGRDAESAASLQAQDGCPVIQAGVQVHQEDCDAPCQKSGSHSWDGFDRNERGLRPALAQKRGGTLVQITQPEPPSLGSYISTANPVGQVASKIYDGLLEYDFDLKPLPSLAESWTVSDDGKTVTFRLRSGVKFHDGKPFTSADVQYTFMDVLKKVHPRGINTFAEVTAVETPDPQTAIFRLNRPAPYMMAALSGYESPILPKHVFSQGDIRTHQNANSPVGTGPFKFVEWRRGEFVRLDRNADYWKPGCPISTGS